MKSALRDGMPAAEAQDLAMTERVLSVWVPGRPVPKPRPSRAKAGHYYTPDTGYEELVAGRWIEAHGKDPIPADVPVSLTLGFFFKRVSRRPDIVNLIMAVCDALQGVAYEDDGQIVHLQAQKLQSSPPQGEGCEIWVARLFKPEGTSWTRHGRILEG